MARDADLARQNHIVIEGGAAGNPRLGADEAMFSNNHVMTDLHQIVDLAPLAHHRAAEARPVDGGIGPDLDVVLEHDIADLGHFLVAAPAKFIAEAVRADNGSRLEPDPFAQDAFGRDRRAGHEPAVLADPGGPADKHLGLQECVPGPTTAPASTTHRGPTVALGSIWAPAATLALGWIPGAGFGQSFCSRRAQISPRAREGLSTTKCS